MTSALRATYYINRILFPTRKNKKRNRNVIIYLISSLSSFLCLANQINRLRWKSKLIWLSTHTHTVTQPWLCSFLTRDAIGCFFFFALCMYWELCENANFSLPLTLRNNLCKHRDCSLTPRLLQTVDGGRQKDSITDCNFYRGDNSLLTSLSSNC